MGDIFEDNLALNAREARQGLLELKSRPVSLMFTATTACNLACIMCSRASRPGELSPASARKLAELFPYLQDLNIQGGEPLLARWLDSFLEQAAGFPKMRKYLTTNGLLIDRARAELLARADVNLIWSIDSPRPEVYEHIRRGARFEALLRALDALNEANARTGRSPRKELNVVVMRSNAGHLREFLPFALKHRFGVINLAPILFNDGKPEDIFSAPEPGALEKLRADIAALSDEAVRAGVRVQSSVPGTAFAPAQAQGAPQAPAQETPAPAGADNASAAPQTPPAPAPGEQPRAPRVICLQPWRQLFVDLSRENGPEPKNVFPECFCPHPLGNIETDSIEQLWNGPAMRQYRKRLLENDVDSFCCPACLQRLSRERFL